jgi:hypothetical protein
LTPRSTLKEEKDKDNANLRISMYQMLECSRAISFNE